MEEKGREGVSTSQNPKSSDDPGCTPRLERRGPSAWYLWKGKGAKGQGRKGAMAEAHRLKSKRVCFDTKNVVRRFCLMRCAFSRFQLKESCERSTETWR